jgi:signal transduction histidine kinase
MEPDCAGELLRVVIVEDSEDDAYLILHELRRAGFVVRSQRVETAEALSAALDSAEWDLVLSDHNLPLFSAPEALRLVQRRASHIPFIIISGSIGEDLAVAAMKAGASDYLVKGQLSRLGPAVRRELADAAERRKRTETEDTLRRTESQLRQAQKMEAVGRLAGGIAHDFNNLLTAILGYSEMLLDEMPAEAAARADVEEIKKAGERAAALTRQLLAFSRQQILDPRVTNFNDIVANVDKLLRRVIGEDVELVTVLDPSVSHVKVDQGQMEQVLMNLAVNARDAMPNGGRLCIRTSTRRLTGPLPAQMNVIDPGIYLVATVTDTGTGITAEVLKQIFEPFFTTKGIGHGTGLGLSTVYGIVKQSDGYITVDSEPGRGTSFEIYLPCVNEPVDAGPPADTLPGGRHGWETVLVVDDDQGARDLLRRALAASGYKVLAAVDGADALSVAASHSGDIHILVTDLVMPRKSGVELAAELSRSRGEMPVLFMSGYTDRRDWKPDAAQPDRALLQKPFTPRAFMRKVRELLDATAGAGSGNAGAERQVNRRNGNPC